MDSDDADVLYAIAVTAFLNNEVGKKVKNAKSVTNEQKVAAAKK